MKTKNNKGFTLIELILVIVILGILAAVAIPKMSGMLDKAREATENAVISQIEAGLNQYAANLLITTGQWEYPVKTTDVLSAVLDETPDNWTYLTATTQFQHTRDDGDIMTWVYDETQTTSGKTRGTYSIADGVYDDNE